MKNTTNVLKAASIPIIVKFLWSECVCSRKPGISSIRGPADGQNVRLRQKWNYEFQWYRILVHSSSRKKFLLLLCLLFCRLILLITCKLSSLSNPSSVLNIFCMCLCSFPSYYSFSLLLDDELSGRHLEI